MRKLLALFALLLCGCGAQIKRQPGQYYLKCKEGVGYPCERVEMKP